MITIGLTGWGDHDSLYNGKVAPRDKLKEYSAYFPVVEVDASFYAVQPAKNAERWVRETPDTFQFIVKAYQGMTGHQRGEIPFTSKSEMFQAFLDSLQPYKEASKLSMVLFQFPPWFDCQRENVELLRWCRDKMGDIPCALEFRHQSWFKDDMKTKTLDFMRNENWIHSVCDEPQAGEGSVPTILEATTPDKILVRFHGRNVHGWNYKSGQNWRDVRYLYRYNEKELADWANNLKELEKQTDNVIAVFNNNSGGDAADNALQMMKMLDIEYSGLNPRQLDLF
ncbi:DUF72 domain-containing protein [Mesobacillus foraminis]|uniref:Uncharacterized protein YecE (DUF72 family) n=1 Tax=Mesobacillus foraminis TaxID=279826 RepID=A0A4R2BJU3_9BACI|nr:DUF72 domain-containing protein [Mesobacillus foraminis]TCN26905.1 uncharacterized protein YecE (DUF72 family) [Mesobacillus foraminis]